MRSALEREAEVKELQAALAAAEKERDEARAQLAQADDEHARLRIQIRNADDECHSCEKLAVAEDECQAYARRLKRNIGKRLPDCTCRLCACCQYIGDELRPFLGKEEGE
jgi:chromosome segregation ATPase